jgi:hypothetical protein
MLAACALISKRNLAQVGWYRAGELDSRVAIKPTLPYGLGRSVRGCRFAYHSQLEPLINYKFYHRLGARAENSFWHTQWCGTNGGWSVLLSGFSVPCIYPGDAARVGGDRALPSCRRRESYSRRSEYDFVLRQPAGRTSPPARPQRPGREQPDTRRHSSDVDAGGNAGKGDRTRRESVALGGRT